MSPQCLGNKQRVFGVITHHATAKQEAVRPLTVPHPPDTILRNSLGCQPQHIPSRRAQQYSGEAILHIRGEG